MKRLKKVFSSNQIAAICIVIGIFLLIKHFHIKSLQINYLLSLPGALMVVFGVIALLKKTKRNISNLIGLCVTITVFNIWFGCIDFISNVFANHSSLMLNVTLFMLVFVGVIAHLIVCKYIFINEGFNVLPINKSLTKFQIRIICIILFIVIKSLINTIRNEYFVSLNDKFLFESGSIFAAMLISMKIYEIAVDTFYKGDSQCH